jgi:drug/metabolite transporter (DMT)-like permease
MSPQRWLVLVAVVAGMGLSAPLIRLAEASALAVVVWRIALSWPVLGGMAVLRREHWPRQGVYAGAFLVVHWLAWALAVQSTSIAAAATLVSTGSLWATVLSHRLLGEPVPRRQWAGLVVALCGVALVVTSGPVGRHSLVGDGWALLSSLTWVGYAFVGRRARAAADFWGYTASVWGVAGGLAVVLAIATGVPLLPLEPSTWLALLGLACLPTLLGHGGLNYLLKHMPAAQLTLWTLGETVISTLLAWPLFAEMPSPHVLAGAALTIGGVALGLSAQLPTAAPLARAHEGTGVR